MKAGHRAPPMIAPWPPRGFCAWCGGAITHGRVKARGWHDGRKDEPNCLGAYKVAAFSADQRHICLERDKGVCRDCGRNCEEPGSRYPWEADHQFPLWLVDRTKPRGEILVYWSAENLVTRCADCHKSKSAEEAAARAKGKRLQGKTARKRAKKAGPKRKPLLVRKIDGSTRPAGQARMA